MERCELVFCVSREKELYPFYGVAFKLSTLALYVLTREAVVDLNTAQQAFVKLLLNGKRLAVFSCSHYLRAIPA